STRSRSMTTHFIAPGASSDAFITGMKPFVVNLGAPKWPPNPPGGSARLGKAEARLDRAQASIVPQFGGPEMAPKPPGWLGAPRQSRGAPRSRTGVNCPSIGAPKWPPHPPGGSARPGKAEARLDASVLSIQPEAEQLRRVLRGDLADDLLRHPG